LRAGGTQAAATIVALLQEVRTDPRIQELLTVDHFGEHATESFHVRRWVEQQRKGRNLWRIKIWDLESLGLTYRVVYALDPRFRRYYVLGVVHRDFDYDENDDRTKRMLAAYDSLGIPTYA